LFSGGVVFESGLSYFCMTWRKSSFMCVRFLHKSCPDAQVTCRISWLAPFQNETGRAEDESQRIMAADFILSRTGRPDKLDVRLQSTKRETFSACVIYLLCVGYSLSYVVKYGWTQVDSCWNVMAHGDAREGKWRGNWRMEWVASTLHTTFEHDVSSITTADAYTSAASSRLNWRPLLI